MGKCLETLAELRDSYNFPCVNELDYALGAAVRSMGVDIVLKHIPYQISFNEKGGDFSFIIEISKVVLYY